MCVCVIQVLALYIVAFLLLFLEMVSLCGLGSGNHFVD